MNFQDILRKTRSFMFFIGAIISKVKYIPFLIISPYFHLFALSFYVLGYLLDYACSLIEHSHKPRQDKWFGFLDFKKQYSLSSTVGLIASLLCIAGIFVPVIMLPAIWLFLAGNILKSISEYHKFKSPPPDEIEYTHSKQKLFYLYSVTHCLLALVGAIATTMVFVFPPATIFILVFATLVGLGIGALSLDYWLDSFFEDHKQILPEHVDAYEVMLKKLTDEFEPKSANEPELIITKPFPSYSPLINKSATTLEQISYQSDRYDNYVDASLTTGGTFDFL